MFTSLCLLLALVSVVISSFIITLSLNFISKRHPSVSHNARIGMRESEHWGTYYDACRFFDTD